MKKQHNLKHVSYLVNVERYNPETVLNYISMYHICLPKIFTLLFPTSKVKKRKKREPSDHIRASSNKIEQTLSNLPLVITEFVAVVVSWDDINEQDVFGFGVHPGHFNLVAGKHPPVEEDKRIRKKLQ